MRYAALLGILVVVFALSEARSISSGIQRSFLDARFNKLRAFGSNGQRAKDLLLRRLTSLKNGMTHSQRSQEHETEVPASTLNAIIFAGRDCFLKNEFWDALGSIEVFDPNSADFKEYYEGDDEELEACFYAVQYVMKYVKDSSPENRHFIDQVFRMYDHNATCQRLYDMAGYVFYRLLELSFSGYDVEDLWAVVGELGEMVAQSCTINEIEKMIHEGEIPGLEETKRATKQEVARKHARILNRRSLSKQISKRSDDPEEWKLLDTEELEAAQFVTFCILDYENWDDHCSYALDALSDWIYGNDEEQEEARKNMQHEVHAYKCMDLGHLGEEFEAVEKSGEPSLVQDAIQHYTEFLDEIGQLVGEEHCSNYGFDSDDTDDLDKKRETDLKKLKELLKKTLSIKKK